MGYLVELKRELKKTHKEKAQSGCSHVASEEYGIPSTHAAALHGLDLKSTSGSVFKAILLRKRLISPVLDQD